MALQSKSKKYVWVLPAIVGVLALFFFLKPSTTKTVNVAKSSTTDAQVNAVKVIRIAVPDMSSSDRPSSGGAIIDNLYLNKVLEQTFAQDNIKVEWQFFKGAGPAINEALVNNQLDFAFLGDLGAIIGKANNIDTRLILATGRNIHNYLAVQPGQGYKNIHDLKGKRIAIFQGTALQLSFNQLLEHYGLTEKDFRIVNLDPAAMNAALVAKQIDGGWGGLGVLALQGKGVIDIIASSKETQSTLGTTQAGLVAVSSFVEQHPEIVQKLVNTVLQSSHWATQPENREAAIKLVTDNAGYPYEIYKKGFEGQDLKNIYSPLLNAEYITQFKWGVKTALATQIIRQDFNVDEWIDDRFVKQGIEQLSYQDTWQ